MDITYQVLEKVCAFMRRNRDVLGDQVCISVNFSAMQFVQSDMVDRVMAIITRYGIPPQLIKIEITESSLIESLAGARQAMQQLNQFGVQIALDAYGHGYSNISFLMELPFGFVKLDKKIVANMDLDSQFVSALVPMFKALDKSIVAEGVESLRQSEILQALGCDAIQGYYYARPMPMEEAVVFYREKNLA